MGIIFENEEEALKYAKRKGFLIIGKEDGKIKIFDRNMRKSFIIYKKNRGEKKYGR